MKKIGMVVVTVFSVFACIQQTWAVSPEEEAMIRRIIEERNGRQAWAQATPEQTAPPKKEEGKSPPVPVERSEVTAVAYTPPAVDATAQPAKLDVVDQAFAAPSSGTDRSKFYEVSAYAGAYRSLKYGSHGLWGMAEYINWNKGQLEPTNFGWGVTVKGDWGETSDGKWDWGSIAIGPNLDYWTELGLGDQWFLAKLRPLWRWKKDGQSGFMPGGYAEYSQSMGQNDLFIAALDGQYFPNDSYGSLSLLWEHRFDPDFRLKGGVSLTTDFTDSNGLGFGPTASVKLYDRFILGWSLSFINAQSLGFYAGYELNSDLRRWDAEDREKSVQKISKEDIP